LRTSHADRRVFTARAAGQPERGML
jgi:hypothetical protein